MATHCSELSFFVFYFRYLPPPSRTRLKAIRKSAISLTGEFIALSAAMVGTSIFDIESTYFALNNCPPGKECKEANPVNRWAVKSGRPVLYALQMSVNGGFIYIAYRLKAGEKYRKI